MLHGDIDMTIVKLLDRINAQLLELKGNYKGFFNEYERGVYDGKIEVLDEILDNIEDILREQK